MSMEAKLQKLYLEPMSHKDLVAYAMQLMRNLAESALEVATLRAELDKANVRDIRDEHAIAELRSSLQEQNALGERCAKENARLRQQLADAQAEVSELNARLEEQKDAAFEMNQGEDL